jgi:hypothetical protein
MNKIDEGMKIGQQFVGTWNASMTLCAGCMLKGTLGSCLLAPPDGCVNGGDVLFCMA